MSDVLLTLGRIESGPLYWVLADAASLTPPQNALEARRVEVYEGRTKA